LARESRKPWAEAAPSVGRARLLEDRWLRAREMRAIRIRRSYVENSRKKEEGKDGLRSLKGSRKTGAQPTCLLPVSHDSFELTYGTPADHLRYAVAQRFDRIDPRNLSLAVIIY
jgi:hypothetical protein